MLFANRGGEFFFCYMPRAKLRFVLFSICLHTAFFWNVALAEAPPASTFSSSSVSSDLGGKSDAENSVPKDESVLPLDVWVPTPALSGSSSSETSSKRPSSREYVIVEDEFDNVGKPDPTEPIAVYHHKSKYYPSKKNQLRLKKALAKQKSRVRRYLRQRALETPGGGRGEAEVRICSLNFHYYGKKAQMRKLLRKPLEDYAQREKSFISAIDTAKCHVVAVQGILAFDRKSAKSALSRLASKLMVDDAHKWVSFVGNVEFQSIRNGFLLREPAVEFVSLVSHTDKLLPQFDSFKEKKFLRAPTELVVRVKANGNGKPRLISLISAEFESRIQGRKTDTEEFRMQFADGIRQLMLQRHRELGLSGESVEVVGLFDRASKRHSPSSQILGGSISLKDFRASDGSCSLGEKGEVICENRPRDPASIVGLFSSNLKSLHYLQVSKGVIKQPALFGEENRRYRRRMIREANRLEADVYMLPRSLNIAWERENIAGRYAIGSVKVLNGIEYSPLLWVELNW